VIVDPQDSRFGINTTGSLDKGEYQSSRGWLSFGQNSHPPVPNKNKPLLQEKVFGKKWLRFLELSGLLKKTFLRNYFLE